MDTDYASASREELMQLLQESQKKNSQYEDRFGEFTMKAFQEAPLAIFKITFDGKVIYANRYAVELFGFSDSEQMIGYNMMECVSESQIAEFKESVKKLSPDNASFYQYLLHHLADKPVMYYMWCCVGLFNDDNNLESLVCYCLPKDIQDVIARNLISQIHKERNIDITNREIISSVLNMLIKDKTLSISNILQLLNEHYKADCSGLFRYSSSKSRYYFNKIVLNTKSAFKDIMLDDNAGFECDQIYQDVLEQGNSVVIYNNDWHPKSQLKDFLDQNIGQYESVACVPIILGDRFYGVFIVLREYNTDRWDERELSLLSLFSRLFSMNVERIETQRSLEREKRFTILAMEKSETYSWEYDIENDIFCNNQLILKRYGFPIGEQPVFNMQMFSDIIHPDQLAYLREALSKTLMGEDGDIQLKVKIQTSEGSHYEWFEYRFMTLKNADGKVYYIIGTGTCIEKFKQTEFQLIEARKEAEESNRLKSAFLANMSHEIRTPLNAIVGFSGVLAHTDDLEEKQEYVSIIENNNALLLQLISDILDLSKIEAGAMDFVDTEINVNEMFAELEQSSRLRAVNKKLTIEFVESVPDCVICADRNRIMQVLNNFITNAIKFTAEGFIRFGFRLNDEKQIYFYVSDTGCGISPENQQLVFGRFVKLNTFEQGSGLGLSICQSIVQKLGGRIGVNSTPGKGSEFWFSIPYNPVKQIVDKKPDIEQPICLEKEQKPLILIAEDNDSNYKLFESILKKEYTLIHAWNGLEAVELFKQHQPHIILMDIKMPVLDGYQATSEIRKLCQSVPIIAVTAYAFAEDEQQISKSGFDAYTSKPIISKILKDKIVTLLKKRLVFI